MADYLASVLADAPVSYWRLGAASGTAVNDTTGTNPGTYVGNPNLGVAGLVPTSSSTAAKFNDVAQYATVPDSNSLDVGDVFTLETWIKRTRSGVLEKFLGKGVGAFAFRFDTGNKLELAKQGTGTSVLSTTAIADLLAHHVVVTKSGATQNLYVDGVDVTGAITNLTMANTADPLLFAETFVGTLDEVAIYNYALSAARVAAHWRAGVSLSAKGGLGVGSSRSSPIVRTLLLARSGFGLGSQADPEIGGRVVVLPGHEAPMRWNGALWLNRNLDENSAPVLPRYEIARIPGRGDTAELESRREARTGARGEVFRRTLRMGKGETIEGAVIAGSLAELQRAVGELRAAFDDPSEGRMEILPHSKQGLFYDYFFRAGEASLTVPDEQAVPPSHSSLGWTRPFVLTLRLPDALYLEAHRRKRIAETIVGGRTTVLCENRGTAAAEPTLMVYGPVTAPWIVYNATAATQLEFLTGIASGSAVEIDFAKRSILLAGVAQRFKRATSNWWDAGVPGLLPGVNEVGLEAPGLVAPARLEVFFNHTLS